ncbi:MAG: anti-sigma factor [Burkholderiaceae bacterium]|nr:anti-sigma factor [Burkholderiaceae bacterium]
MNHGPNDEQLSAWLDSALPDDEQQRVEAWLSTNPEAEARVRAWAADRDALRTLGDAWLAAPVPERLLQVVQRPAPAPVWRQAAMAAGLLVAGAALGACGLWQWQQQARAPLQAGAVAPTTNAWVTRAAYAHAVYVAEPRHAVEVRAQEEHLARWLTRRIDIPVKLFDLHEHGFELIGGRLLPDGDGKSAQLMYQDAQGLRVTVYLRKPPDGTETAFRWERQGELGLFYWVESGAGYALVGALPKATLLTLAEAIYKQHPGAAR